MNARAVPVEALPVCSDTEKNAERDVFARWLDVIDPALAGKRSVRLDVPKQLRVSEPLGRAIRLLAMKSGRTQQQMMVFLLAKGIERYRRETGASVSGLIEEAAADTPHPQTGRQANAEAERGNSKSARFPTSAREPMPRPQRR